MECSTARPSYVSHYGAMLAGQSPIHVLTRLMIALTSVIKRKDVRTLHMCLHRASASILVPRVLSHVIAYSRIPTAMLSRFAAKIHHIRNTVLFAGIVHGKLLYEWYRINYL